MLAIQSAAASTQLECAVNLLPCKVHHTGPANATEKHWKIETNDKGEKVTYFRGRRLVGKDIALPEGYTGAILETTDEVVASDDMDVDDEEKAPETKVVKQLGSFEKMTVWGHEVQQQSSEDAVLKSVEEWMAFAGKIHDFEEDEN